MKSEEEGKVGGSVSVGGRGQKRESKEDELEGVCVGEMS